ncbi:MAG TPA: hypothetical protein VFT56_16685 [Sphingomonas sp.]|nr:hypothetical protein [Sphingomonas sp.]
MTTLHDSYWQAVEAIERDCRVTEWRTGDLDLWPLARQDLFLDLFRGRGGDTAPPPPPFAVRAASSLGTPLTNLWKSRHDLAHWLPRPRRADAVLLGDGVSLDRIGGAWRDRYGEPIVAALERRGRSCLMMQPGTLSRLPWARPTFAVNTVAARAALAAALAPGPAPHLPDHRSALDTLARAGIAAPSLSVARLARRARVAAAQAAAFDRILDRVRPTLAFVVTHYAGLGHAFALACRRRGVLCIDVQHCPQDEAHRGYRWPTLPAAGYTTLPGLFWTWSAAEAARIDGWAGTLDRPWHRAIHGGHSQIAGYNDAPDRTAWDAAFDAAAGATPASREILVALQPIGGRLADWQALAAAIASAPPDWRWWIRRHPAAAAAQDGDHACLLALRGAAIVIEPAARLPLPVLMRRMSALVSLASGTAGEAAAFGVPAFFLSDEARGPFAGLIASGAAAVVDAASLIDAITRLPAASLRTPVRPPPLDGTLDAIERIAADYAGLCAAQPAPARRRPA